MIIDCIADLHGHYPKLDGGDLLIVAGDLTARDQAYEYVQFGIWLNHQKYKKKIIIAGNHDNIAQKAEPFINPGTDEWEYLCDSGTEFEGLRIWGSPWTKTFEGMNPHCMAFTCDTEEELAEKWAMIPNDVDILVTHGPPYTVFDVVPNMMTGRNEPKGSISLLSRVIEIQPILHTFGHIHEHGGRIQNPREGLRGISNYFGVDLTIFVNASHVNEHYQPVNKPVRVIL